MNKLVGLLITSLCSLPVVAQSESWKMAVLSDIHVMAPELLQKEGKAFDNYIVHDRKLLQQSTELVQTCIQDLLTERPEVVLITGDLTKDGEKMSHEYVVHHLLQPLEAAGCRVYVIPGNHDVNNPHAAIFRGDSLQRTTTVSAEEFASLYHDYGYGEALARDSASLSYVVQLDSHTRLLAIDACKHEENDYTQNTCVTGGRIKPETMAFIRRQVQDAERQHCRMVTMMHHGLVRHWKWQDKVMKDYLIDDWKKRSKEFQKLHLNLVFTGHFHAQDIAARGKGSDTLYDIETGSLVSFPLPYRMVTFTHRYAEIDTRHITSIPSIPDSTTLHRMAHDYALGSIHTIASSLLPKHIPPEIINQCTEVLGQAYAAHLKGDEEMPPAWEAKLKQACKALRKYSWKYAFVLGKLGRYFYTDDLTPDNTLRIPLHTQD